MRASGLKERCHLDDLKDFVPRRSKGVDRGLDVIKFLDEEGTDNSLWQLVWLLLILFLLWDDGLAGRSWFGGHYPTSELAVDRSNQ